MNNYMSDEVQKIIGDPTLPNPQNYAMATAWILGNLKGLNLKIIDVSNVSSITDYFIIGSATNIVQASSMADAVSGTLRKFGQNCRSKEGKDQSDWVLLDFGNYIVHIFLETARYAYDLDGLWGQCPILPIPQNYYFSSPEHSAQNINAKSEKGYF